MRRWSSLVLVPVLLACHTQAEPREPAALHRAPDQPQTVRLSGELRDHAGERLAAAHLTVYRSNYREPLLDAELGDDGRFELELPISGGYLVRIAGVDHAREFLSFSADQAPVELVARLGTYPREQPGDTLPLKVRWLDADGQPGAAITVEATRATASDDHRLSLEVPAGARALQYQLISERGTFNGPGGRRWRYDGDGDYWAEVDSPAGSTLELSLDLDALPPAGRASKIELRGALSYPQAEARALLWSYQTDIRELFERLATVEDEHEVQREAAESIQALAADARERVEALDDPQLAKAAALEWIGMFGQFGHRGWLDADALTWVFERVPAEDPFWAFGAWLVSSVFAGFLDSPAIQAQRVALAEHQRDPGLLAALLFLDLSAADQRGDQAAILEIYPRLAQGYPGSYPAFHAATQFDPERPLLPGKPMPEWSFPSLDGDASIQSSDLAGQAYLLDIWATWCGPCVAEMPALHQAHAAMLDSVRFVGLSIDDSAHAVASFREQWPMPWTHAIVPSDQLQALYDRWSFSGIPTLVLVDADGIIVAVNEGLRGESVLPTLQAFVAR